MILHACSFLKDEVFQLIDVVAIIYLIAKTVAVN